MLIEGLRNVRARSVSPTRRRVPEDLDPPPPALGKNPDDSDSEDDFAVGVGTLASETLGVAEGGLTCDSKRVHRIVLTV